MREGYAMNRKDAKVNFSSWVKIIQLFDNTIGKKIKASSMCDVEE